ncbi:MAG: hypothetical protein KDD58_13725 [Bdellovibrionales bacterium]|nr:hypothetical protein [Bdellovibrionales bacterium]
MRLLLVLFTFLSFSSAWAVECPEELSVYVGSLETTTSTLISDRLGADQLYVLVKEKGKRVCHYSGDSFSAKVVINETKKNGFESVALEITVGGDSVGDEGLFGSVVLEEDEFNSGYVKRNSFMFEHYSMYLDEEGCAFRMTSCDPQPVTTGDSTYSSLEVSF